MGRVGCIKQYGIVSNFYNYSQEGWFLNYMNRTYSQFRAFTQPKPKTRVGTTPAYQFRTLLKFRNNHRAYEEAHPNRTPHRVNATQLQQLASQEYETAGQHQMRQFIKVMKNGSRGIQISNQSLQQAKHEPSCPTSRSNTSQASIRNLNSSHFRCATNQAANQVHQQDLDQLQKKVEHLIKMRIGRKVELRPTQLLTSRIQEDQASKDLKDLVDQVQRYTKARKNEDSVDLDIKDIKQKINIYEKALASRCTQNQVLKTMYSSTQKVRKTFAVLDEAKPGKRSLSASQKFILPSPPSIQLQTTNRSHFVKPSQMSYLAKETKKPNYIINRQPLPRSLYQRQFLYYGIVPTYSANPQAQAHHISSEKGHHQAKIGEEKNQNKHRPEGEHRPTLYTKQYKQKKAHIVDSKQLDCREDKFKNVNISFMPKKKGPWRNLISKNENQPQLSNLNRKQVKDKTNDSWLKYSLSSSKQNKSPACLVGKTEHQSQYKLPVHVGKSEKGDGQKECLMKEKNLNSLKYAYKYAYSYE